MTESQELRNAELKGLAGAMQEFSIKDGDIYSRAAKEIERLMMIENLTLVSGRCVGDDDDTVALYEGDGWQAFEEALTQGEDIDTCIVTETRLADAIESRYRSVC